MSELSEFEKKRLENIKRNQELLKSLEFEAINDSIAATRPAATSPASTTRSKRAASSSTSHKRRAPVVAKPSETVVPLRKSRRLLGIKADDEVAREEAEKAYDIQRNLEAEKRTRVGGDIDLDSLLHTNGNSEDSVDSQAWEQMWYNFSGGEKVSEGDFFDKIKHEEGNRNQHIKQENDIDAQNNKNENKSISQLREEISNLQLDERFDPVDIRITPERIFSMAFHPTPTKPLIFAGDKVGTLGIWDAHNPLNSKFTDSKEDVKKEDEEEDEVEGQDNDEQPNIVQLKIHSRTISSIRFSPESNNTTKVFTSSYDGSIRLLDLNKKVSSEIYVYPSDPRNPMAISDLCFAGSDPNLIYFTTLEGQLGRKDIRQGSKTNDADLYRLHDKKIGGFNVNPLAPHLVVTASLDRTMKLWDMRMITKTEDGELSPRLCGVYDSRLSISCAEWNRNNHVVINGYDDSIRVFDFNNTPLIKPEFKTKSSLKSDSIYDMEDNVESLVSSARVKHNCQTGRWVTILKAHWQQSPSDGIDRFVIGNMNRYIDVYTADGRQLAHLGHPLMSAVPAVSQFHPTRNWIVGGSASGKAYLWT